MMASSQDAEPCVLHQSGHNNDCLACWRWQALEKKAKLQEKDAQLQEKDSQLQAKLQAKLQEREAKLQEKDAKLQEIEAKLQKMKAEFRSLGEIAQTSIILRDETASSSHLNPNNVPAAHTTMKRLPDVTLPKSFWECRCDSLFPPNGSINSEFDVNAGMGYLMRTIIKALGLKEHVFAMLNVAIMDTAPDVTLVMACNKHFIGTVEAKKPCHSASQKEQLFGSPTKVAGQTFEQLFICCIQNETAFSVGLLCTLGSFQLVSNVDLSERKDTLDPARAIEYFEAISAEVADVTPDMRKVIADDHHMQVTETRKREISSVDQAAASVEQPATKREKLRVKQTPNKQEDKGRLTRAVQKRNVPRSYYASKVYEFGNTGSQNREVFKLLALYVLLCVESHKEKRQGPNAKGDEPQDLRGPDLKCMARLITATSAFASLEIMMKCGVQFQNQPTPNASTFYAIRQLGFGLSGACCFAVTSSSAPCVIKFYRKDDDATAERAKEEADMWEKIYGDFGIDFAHVVKTPRLFLLMPYLSTPCTLSERKKLVEGKSDQDSMLHKALEHFASKDHIHEEVRWHHVGLWKVKKAAPKRRGSVQSIEVGTEFAVFCDLDHAKPSCLDAQAKAKWVETTFVEMKQRIGE